jgi:hypothetical protein
VDEGRLGQGHSAGMEIIIIIIIIAWTPREDFS